MKRRNFIIFFQEKEGTSALVRMLDKFAGVSILHRTDGTRWEPFNHHNCGTMSLPDLKQCFDLVYGDSPVDMQALNRIYTRKSPVPLTAVEPDSLVGCKMRFVPPIKKGTWWAKIPGVKDAYYSAFKQLMLETLQQYEICTFIAIRQNTLKWALSKYHGSGTGGQGRHLQFRLAKGELSKDEIGKIHVDPQKLGQLIKKCEAGIQSKVNLANDLMGAGIPTHPLLYEDFCDHKLDLFCSFFKTVGADISEAEIKSVVEEGTSFQKVHSEQISDFVINHEEILELYGDRFFDWQTKNPRAGQLKTLA